MKSITLTEDLWQGAISIEAVRDGFKPWRIPYHDYDLFPPDGIGGKAALCAGVRLRLRTNSSTVGLSFEALKEDDSRIDCVVDGVSVSSLELREGDTEAIFSNLPPVMKVIEIYLPQQLSMVVTGLRIEAAAEATASPDSRQRWLTYGSSITQCNAAYSPSRTWPATAANLGGLNLTCLGFGGNCHLEPMVARLIRDTPADFISMCIGINIYGAASLSPRTFKPALIGMLETIREKHQSTPLLVISPIFSCSREMDENKVGFTITAMREEIRQTVEMLKHRGDRNLYYHNGLQWFGEADQGHLPDGLHPDAAGYELMGTRFVEHIIRPFRGMGVLL